MDRSERSWLVVRNAYDSFAFAAQFRLYYVPRKRGEVEGALLVFHRDGGEIGHRNYQSLI